jgi:hypothetical protein
LPEAATAAGGRRVWWRAAAVERFSRTPVNVEWSSLLKGQRPFVLPRIYPDWIQFKDAMTNSEEPNDPQQAYRVVRSNNH